MARRRQSWSNPSPVIAILISLPLTLNMPVTVLELSQNYFFLLLYISLAFIAVHVDLV